MTGQEIQISHPHSKIRVWIMESEPQNLLPPRGAWNTLVHTHFRMALTTSQCAAVVLFLPGHHTEHKSLVHILIFTLSANNM